MNFLLPGGMFLSIATLFIAFLLRRFPRAASALFFTGMSIAFLLVVPETEYRVVAILIMIGGGIFGYFTWQAHEGDGRVADLTAAIEEHEQDIRLGRTGRHGEEGENEN